jgi:hypothetical protein
MILLALDGHLPPRLYRALVRTYATARDTRLYVAAARPARYRLMVSDPSAGAEPAEEWVRISGHYKIPIGTPGEALARLREARLRHPEYRWSVEPVTGERWRRPERI